MTQKLPRHTDLDSEILSLDSPVKLAMQLGCVATVLIALMVWLALIGAMTAGVIDWLFWPFVVGPIAAWVILLGLPALLSARRGALSVLGAIVMTGEAWLSRAKFSIDLNDDGYIGHAPVQIEPVQTQVIRPAIWSGPGGTRLLTQEATAAAIPDVATAPDPAPVTRRVWEMPDGAKIPQETLEDFCTRIFLIGWQRDTWVKSGKLDRETYDSLITLFVRSGIIEGRKPGTPGKLTINDPATAKRILGLN